ncbi:MAG: MATE family efflux transporter [Rhodobacteraceae bacterium]|nr:MATE family efflux transporter [Paracoccaceae bacterium]
MSAASSIGLMAIFLVDLADLYFISLLGQAELAAAVGYSGAILFFTTSVSIGLAIAMGALVARSLGAGNQEQARLYATHVLAFSLALSVPVAVLVWVFVPELVALVGASGRTADLATQYLRIVVPSLPFMFCLMAGGSILRAHGDARRAMMATIAMGAVNAVLDPLLIFGLGPLPGFGLDGAAAASVAARVAGAVVAIQPVLRRYGGFSPLRMGAFIGDLPVITRLAFPAMLTNIATPIGAAFVTREIASFGDAAVAGYAIVGRVTPVAFSVVFALSGAIGPIVGQNFGARSFDRVRGALTSALLFLAGYVAAVSLLLFLLRAPLADAFSASGVGRELVFWFCGPLALAFFFNGAVFVANASFNNLERPFTSTLVNWARHTLGTIPPAMLGGALLGAPGVLIGQALGGVLFAVLAVWMAYRLVDAHESGRAERSATTGPVWRWPQWPFSSPRG